MGYRINRAMGWGMPAATFNEIAFPGQLKPPPDEPTEILWETFGARQPADFVVPEETYNALFYAEGPAREPLILEPNLLAKTFRLDKDHVPAIGDPRDLFKQVCTPDETLAVIFFPNLIIAKRWCRWDDDLDYAFEQWRSLSGGIATETADPQQQEGPRDVIVWPRYGFYPWTNNLMLADGTPTPWEMFWKVEKHPEWLPAVPSEIRWYTKMLGVFDDAGVNQLRPILAQWWA